jgi:hypothetical protein
MLNATVYTPCPATVQPFGLMPALRNLSRQASFTHELKLPSPASSLICSSSPSSKRMIFRVLFVRSVLFFIGDSCIGSYHYANVILNGMNHFKFGSSKKQRPVVLATHTGRLTTNVSESNEVAMSNTITPQTGAALSHPKYQYRFMALDRADRQAKPCKIIVEATSEHEARKVLAAHYILSLAAVLPIQEVRHA